MRLNNFFIRTRGSFLLKI